MSATDSNWAIMLLSSFSVSPGVGRSSDPPEISTYDGRAVFFQPGRRMKGRGRVRESGYRFWNREPGSRHSRNGCEWEFFSRDRVRIPLRTIHKQGGGWIITKD